MSDQWQIDMRVCRCIAMAWKVLCTGENSHRLDAAHDALTAHTHLHRILSKRAHMDDRVERIAIHIADRRQIEMDPDRTALLADLLAKLVKNRIVLHSTQCEIARKRGHITQAHSHSPFCILNAK